MTIFISPATTEDASFGHISDSRVAVDAHWVDYESGLQISRLNPSYLFSCCANSLTRFLLRWSRAIILDLNKRLERGLETPLLSSSTLMSNSHLTHGWILLENLCRRIRAMVVRTAKVVHMVLTLAIGSVGAAEFRAPGPLPLKGSDGERQQRWWWNSSDYSCLPSWLWLTVGEISTRD